MESKRRYTLLAFPQRFDGLTLQLNLVLIPRNRDPFQPLDTELPAPNDTTTAFADLVPQFRIGIIRGLDEFPLSNPGTPEREPVLESITVTEAINKRNLLTGIAQEFAGKLTLDHTTDKANAPMAEEKSVRKYLPESYRKAFNFTTPRHRNAVTDDSYHCAIRDEVTKKPWANKDEVSWGQLYAHILRQPILAKACGLIYETSVTVQADWFENGGYLYAEMINDDVANVQEISLEDANGPFVKRYAARIPKLTMGEARPVFAPLLFPVLYRKTTDVVDPEPKGQWDQVFAEVNEYNDGFAKIVHARQAVSGNLLSEGQDGFHPVKESGIRLGWDDEQILIWYIRQLVENPADPGSGNRLDAPLGVFGYAIDVKEAGAATWESLNLLQAKQAYDINGQALGNAADERVEVPYQVYPTQITNNTTESYWLPMYYANWLDHSLVMKDTRAAYVYRNDEEGTAQINAGTPRKVGLEQRFDEVAVSTPLRYSRSYQFRVRLTDISGGGPRAEEIPLHLAPAPEAAVHFKRYIAPALLHIDKPEPLLTNQVDCFNETLVAGESVYDANPTLRVNRPLLGYPAVVFTNKYQLAGQDPIELLRTASGDATNQTAFGISDPDVTRVEVTVEVETLRMDNLLSPSGRENYIRLYTTHRNFAADFAAALEIPVTFRDVPVLDLGNTDNPFGDAALNQAALDAMNEIVLPTARKVRVTLRAVASGDSTYWGFINEADHSLDSRYGQTTQLRFYKESDNEEALLLPEPNVPTLQALWLQPDREWVNDGQVATFLLRRETPELLPDVVQRLANELGVQCKGLTLVANKGERIVFGCSSRIRHQLSPDHSSITFASKADLVNHWLGCITYRLNRDWSWDALEAVSFSVDRWKKFRHDADTEAEEVTDIGDIELKHTVPFEALQPDRFKRINRHYTTLIYIDAIEPKTALTQANGQLRFPDELQVRYTLRPHFRENLATVAGNEPTELPQIDLPTTTNPVQVPKIASVGMALSPYRRNEKYSATEPRQRYLWVEFAEPVHDPNDTVFCRVLASAPDQLLSNNHPELWVAPQEPSLPIDPEVMRVITPGQSDDMAGLSAMQAMEKSTDSDRHYLMPLPAGLHAESPELFGFFTYEFRIGHGHWSERPDNLWSTAQGRFGRALRVTGMQHPAPALLSAVNRDEDFVYVNAPYAQAVHNGKNVTSDPPRTELWGLLYAQVKRADGTDFRNILLDNRRLDWKRKLKIDKEKRRWQFTEETRKAYGLQVREWLTPVAIQPQATLNVTAASLLAGAQKAIFKDLQRTGLAVWSNTEIAQRLKLLGLPEDAPLSVLVVEIFGNITSLKDHITNLQQDNVRANTLQTVRTHGSDIKAYQTTERQLMQSADLQSQAMFADNDNSPLGSGLGHYRILRTSPLTEVPFVCCPTC